MKYGNIMPMKWSREQTDLLIKLFNEEKSMDEIADHLNALIDGTPGFRNKVTRSPKAIAMKLFRLGLISEERVEEWANETEELTKTQRKDKLRDEKNKVLKREEEKCAVCGKRGKLEFAHIVPFRRTKINYAKEAVALCHEDHLLFDEKNAFEVKKVYDHMCKKYSDYWKEYKLCEEYNQMTNKDKMWIGKK
ncbi:MAG: GcrA family cell cycle regulator [archaeon]|nr:GcrA family cell cycle regulator [archaeon]MCR4323665.1 GcrA family cell cycle regulator [Nanoarchaeota archaeon]